MIIKICGLTNVCEADYLKENKVDLAGIVLFFEKSKRNITIETAKSIIAKLHPQIKAVAVTVSPTIEQVKQIEAAGFDYLQVHGKSDEELLKNCSIPVLRAFNVDDLDKYDYYLGFDIIKGFVFDAGEPGSGKTFDWDVLKTLKRDPKRLYILAGGLNDENVAKAVQSVKPDGVDISSGVEFSDKQGKDPDKIREFVKRVRE